MTTDNIDITIDFSRLGGPVYVGREKGARVRSRFDLDSVDTSEKIVKVNVPKETYSINSSFFLGLFGKSIKRAGSAEAFFDKYVFDMPEHLRSSIESSVSRALFEKSSLLDGDD